MKTVKINWLNQTAIYNYDAAGRLTDLTQFNGTTVAYGYDNANRLTSLSNNGNTVLASYSFTLDGNGNRTQVVRNEPLTATLDTGLTSYNYNDKKNRLLSTSTEGSFVYDYYGKLANGYGTYYTFDNNEHRLLGIGSAYQFAYDGMGNRLRATRSGVITRYIHDAAGNVVAEADGNNSITRYYIHGQGLLATVTPANQVYCYHFDATANTVAMTDGSKNIVNKYAYDAFGKISGQVEAIAQPFKYVGQYGVMAELNGFYYMRARYYDPKVGRFISEDPSGFDGGDVNLYAYVQNNPINKVDPSGLFTWYYGGSATAYYGNKGNATVGAGSIGYSDETGWFKGNYATYGAEKARVDDIRTTTGAGAGAGPVMGFFTGPLSGFQGATQNLTVEAFGIGITFSQNDSGWGLSISTGGKGVGLGSYINTTNTKTYPCGK